ncbi:secreted protein containing SH3, type 3 domain protein [Candidatus Magnetobacterium bavaricum]|uniref:Secreted protein containing SH3, type 3 domain protein n=1 Tax=Candidatus Magnetobacterium bavaricum TaxID=29290 RepID=A0A0F3GS78_9BACT|nr:secreted protein containing SH3, type 3 domain protein [Candidatus Magnetobacterium bavaricum]
MKTKSLIALVLLFVSISCSTPGGSPGGAPSATDTSQSAAPPSHTQKAVTPADCISSGGFWVRSKGSNVRGLCQSEPGSASVGVLNTTSNIRKLPQKSSDIVAVLQKGDVVFIHETNEHGMTRVSTVCTLEGWVLSKYLTVTSTKAPHAIQAVDIKIDDSVKREQKLNIEIEFITTGPKESAQLFFCLHPQKEEPSEHLKGKAEFADKGQWTYAKSFNISKNAPIGDWIAHVAIYHKNGWLDTAEIRFKVTQ